MGRGMMAIEPFGIGTCSERRYAMRSFVRTSVILAAGAVIAGCSGAAKLYEGEQQPKDKVATLIDAHLGADPQSFQPTRHG